MRDALQFKGTEQLTPISGKLSRKNEKWDQVDSDLAGTPGRVFLLDAQNGAFDLVWQPVGLPVRCAAAIVQAIQASFLVAVEYLVAGDTGDAELTA